MKKQRTIHEYSAIAPGDTPKLWFDTKEEAVTYGHTLAENKKRNVRIVVKVSTIKEELYTTNQECCYVHRVGGNYEYAGTNRS